MGWRCARATGWPARPVIVCVSRLMPRKGDTLIEALPLIQRSIPDAALLIVGAVRTGRSCRTWSPSWAWGATWC